MVKRQLPDSNGRVTLRDLMEAVASVYERVDDAHGRIDAVVTEQSNVTVALTNLRTVVNDEIHKIKDDISLLKRPWRLAGGWAGKVLSAALGAAGVSAWVFIADRWPL